MFGFEFVLMLSRASLVFAVQTWLAETPDQAKKAGTPSYLSVGMSGRLTLRQLAINQDRGETMADSNSIRSHGCGSGQSSLRNAL